MKSSTQRQTQSSKPTTARLLLLGLLILGIAAAIIIPLYFAGKSMMGGSSPDTQAQLASASPGSHVKVVCEVISLQTDNFIKGTFLTQNGDGSYARTTRVVNIQWKPGQQVIMGSSHDVHRGAIIQVSGRVDNNGLIRADEVVILTGAVTVK